MLTRRNALLGLGGLVAGGSLFSLVRSLSAETVEVEIAIKANDSRNALSIEPVGQQSGEIDYDHTAGGLEIVATGGFGQLADGGQRAGGGPLVAVTNSGSEPIESLECRLTVESYDSHSIQNDDLDLLVGETNLEAELEEAIDPFTKPEPPSRLLPNQSLLLGLCVDSDGLSELSDRTLRLKIRMVERFANAE